MYLKKEYIGTPQKQTIPMYLPLQIHQIKQSLELHPPTESIKIKDIYTEVPSEYSVYEYRLFLLYFYMKRPYGLIINTKKELLYQKYTKEYKLYDI